MRILITGRGLSGDILPDYVLRIVKILRVCLATSLPPP